MRYLFFALIFLFSVSASPLLSAKEKIWDVAAQKFISEDTLFQNFSASQTILLGLRRDNPWHHRLAARILKNLARQDRNPSIFLGDLERNKQNAFAIFAQRDHGSLKDYDATGLDMLLDWSHSAQPDWAIVSPVYNVAMLEKIPLYAAAFSRYEIGQIHQQGLRGLPRDVKKSLSPLLATPLPAEIKNHLISEITRDYCEPIPPEVIQKMTLIHRAQSGLFALEMANISHGSWPRTSVLIAARDYVMKGIGVPRYLKDMALKGSSLSLSFLEKGENPRKQKVDFIWYTDKISRPDPCGRMTAKHP